MRDGMLVLFALTARVGKTEGQTPILAAVAAVRLIINITRASQSCTQSVDYEYDYAHEHEREETLATFTTH
jgi:hypothetical protein